jgi:hypothetical protein
MEDCDLRRFLALMLVASVALGLPTNAVAFNLLGGRWASICCSNTTYFIYSGGNDAAAWGQAVSDWKATATPIWIAADVRDHEDIGLQSTTNNSVSWDGLTQLFPSQTANPYVYASAFLNDFYTNGYGAAKRQSVAEHELGHVFGLAHHNGVAVLMNGFTCGANSRWCTFSVNTPKGDDVNGINAIY